MKAYTGRTRDPYLIELLAGSGVGVVLLAEDLARGMVGPKAKRARPMGAGGGERGVRMLEKLIGHWPRWFLDNGAFIAWREKRAFDVPSWGAATWLLEAAAQAGRHDLLPDFAVLPDIVGGVSSLEMSMGWLQLYEDGRASDLRRRPAIAGMPKLRFALAVQEGMTPAMLPWYAPFSVVFVGGATLEWKMGTAPEWIRAAHDHGRECHIGRVGTAHRVREARLLGADSIDSALPLFSREASERFVAALRGPLQTRLFEPNPDDEDDVLARIIAEQDERARAKQVFSDLAWDTFQRERIVVLPARASLGVDRVSLTRSTYPGVLYQVTRWEGPTPIGHMDAMSAESALEELWYYAGGADWQERWEARRRR